MNFRTAIQISDQGFNIDHTKRILMAGSCFTDNIGKFLKRYKFKTLVNPFGVLYNPASVYYNLKELIKDNNDFKPDLHRSSELWFDYRFHGSFSDIDKDRAYHKINETYEIARSNIFSTDILFITWGTSRVYRLKGNGKIVANCHKQPANIFEREKLKSDHICEQYSELVERMKDINPSIKIVLTVSPVRHLKDGFVENQRSKAELFIASEKLTNQFDNVYYFPSYEIMIDDLRDYRFYDDDMLHPSEKAKEYLWEKFSDTYFSGKTRKLNKELLDIHKAYMHRIQRPESNSSKKFAETMYSKALKIMKENPDIDIEEEINYFSRLKAT